MEKQYSTFSVKSNIDSPITIFNYSEFPIKIYENRKFILSIIPWYLSLDMYQDIFSGNEEAAKQAIKWYLNNLEDATTKLRKLMME